MHKLLIRALILCFWIALIFGLLYLPSWSPVKLEGRSINIFAWGDIFDPAIITRFEKQTGIKVHLNYYTSNEELLVKLKATGGVGYDLVVPSDYAVAQLVREGLLRELDRDQLLFWQELNPLLLNHHYDPDNRFAIPFEWELFGLGVDREYFASHPFTPSWKLIFDPQTVDYKITMLNDPIGAILFASFYLYGAVDRLTPEQAAGTRKLLLEQYPWVMAYADSRGDYFLATRNCPVVVASSSYIWRSKKRFPFIGFVLPEEGTFITIENLAIPRATEKLPLVYAFINYLYQSESMAAHYNTYGFFPATLDVLKRIDLDEEAKALLSLPPESFEQFHFFRNLLPEAEIRNLWVEVKTEG